MKQGLVLIMLKIETKRFVRWFIPLYICEFCILLQFIHVIFSKDTASVLQTDCKTPKAYLRLSIFHLLSAPIR